MKTDNTNRAILEITSRRAVQLLCMGTVLAAGLAFGGTAKASAPECVTDQMAGVCWSVTTSSTQPDRTTVARVTESERECDQAGGICRTIEIWKASRARADEVSSVHGPANTQACDVVAGVCWNSGHASAQVAARKVDDSGS